eukprot:CAMPEP_0115008074 /NCGR_PEP_ID=MMETSP0216-20121206/21658_1 /TAXON_ID=223996 /ORGANISM="Protocruzia adherens, Strain Boccale" /LENGTH=110 /DNA_ID=CAMNT_0002375337 /DNA_START=112 /DNA_END=444 /DNA_ORIENTATION=-
MGCSNSTAADPAIVQRVDSEIKSNTVMVYSKSYCPFCTETKDLLRSHNIAFRAVELDTISDGKQIQKTLRSKTGQSTVPNIFINQKHVGGNSDLQSLSRSGKLESMVKAA